MDNQKQKVLKSCAIAFFVFKILFAFFFVSVIVLAGVTTTLSMRCQVSKTPVDFFGRKVLLVYTDMGMGTAVRKYNLLILTEPKFEDLIIDAKDPANNSIVVYYSKDYKPNGLVAQRILSQEAELKDDLELRFIIKGDTNTEENPTPIKFEEILGVVDHQLGITRLAMLSVTNIWFLIFVLLLPALILIVAQLTGLSEPISIKSVFGKKRDFEEEFQSAVSEEDELPPEVVARVKALLLREQEAESVNSRLEAEESVASDFSVFETDRQELPRIQNVSENAEEPLGEEEKQQGESAVKESLCVESEKSDCKESESNLSIRQNGSQQRGNALSKTAEGKSYPYAKRKYPSGKHGKSRGKRR